MRKAYGCSAADFSAVPCAPAGAAGPGCAPAGGSDNCRKPSQPPSNTPIAIDNTVFEVGHGFVLHPDELAVIREPRVKGLFAGLPVVANKSKRVADWKPCCLRPNHVMSARRWLGAGTACHPPTNGWPRSSIPERTFYPIVGGESNRPVGRFGTPIAETTVRFCQVVSRRRQIEAYN
jgi:hypothetical protein